MAGASSLIGKIDALLAVSWRAFAFRANVGDHKKPASMELGIVLKVIRNLVLISLGILLGLALAECGLRILGIGQQGFYQWDAYRGWALRPGSTGWQHRKGYAFVPI